MPAMKDLFDTLFFFAAIAIFAFVLSGCSMCPNRFTKLEDYKNYDPNCFVRTGGEDGIIASTPYSF